MMPFLKDVIIRVYKAQALERCCAVCEKKVGTIWMDGNVSSKCIPNQFDRYICDDCNECFNGALCVGCNRIDKQYKCRYDKNYMTYSEAFGVAESDKPVELYWEPCVMCEESLCTKCMIAVKARNGKNRALCRSCYEYEYECGPMFPHDRDSESSDSDDESDFDLEPDSDGYDSVG